MKLFAKRITGLYHPEVYQFCQNKDFKEFTTYNVSREFVEEVLGIQCLKTFEVFEVNVSGSVKNEKSPQSHKSP